MKIFKLFAIANFDAKDAVFFFCYAPQKADYCLCICPLSFEPLNDF
jgi:hypothetical protein